MKVIDLSSKEKHQYYNSFKWTLIVRYMLGKYPSCNKCGTTENLIVHHVDYKNYPHEKEEDLLVLCKNCHFNHHNPNYKFSKEEQIEFIQRSKENAIGRESKTFFDVRKISGYNSFLENDKEYFYCEKCGKFIPAGMPYPITDLSFHNQGRFIRGENIPYRNLNRTFILLCPTCRKELNQNSINTIKFTPWIAKILLTNPPKLHNEKINKMGRKKDKTLI